MSERCMSCCEPLDDTAVDSYHRRCARSLFNVSWQPAISFRQDEIATEAQKMIGRMSISGVQPKLSAKLDKNKRELIVTPAGGEYILKPQIASFPELPQNEHMCMNIVDAMGMQTPPHGLLPLADGTLAYIVRRFDRTAEGKKHMEDFCQLMELPPESKYNASMERVGKAVAKFSENPLLDLIDIFERTLLSFLIGNGDMHLKNWSLVETPNGGLKLSPCYDFCSSNLVLPQSEESALTINGKRSNLEKNDFMALAENYQITSKAIDNSFSKLQKWYKICVEHADKSFLSDKQRAAFKTILDQRFNRLKF